MSTIALRITAEVPAEDVPTVANSVADIFGEVTVTKGTSYAVGYPTVEVTTFETGYVSSMTPSEADQVNDLVRGLLSAYDLDAVLVTKTVIDPFVATEDNTR